MDNLFQTFAGEFCRFYIKTVVAAEEDGKVYEGLFNVTGFLLEVDKLYYYIGGSPDAVSTAVKKRDVTMVELVPFEDNNLAILSNMGDKEDKDIH